MSRWVTVCLALMLTACAARNDVNDIRHELKWEADAITWTVENSSPHSIVIDEYREDDIGVPQGVWIRVTDASGDRVASTGDDDGWHSPWMMWSSTWTPRPLELPPGSRIEQTFDVAALAVGLRVSEPIATQRCRYQVRVGVMSADVWNFRTSDWKEIDCSDLGISLPS